MKTAPLSADTVCIPAKRSPVCAANVRAASSCDSPSTLIPSRGTSLSFGQVVDVFCTQNDTSGGSSDTGTKVLTASPTRVLPTSAAIAITPVGKCPNASRRAASVRLPPLIVASEFILRPRSSAPVELVAQDRHREQTNRQVDQRREAFGGEVHQRAEQGEQQRRVPQPAQRPDAV